MRGLWTHAVPWFAALFVAAGCVPRVSPYVLDFPLPTGLPFSTQRYRLDNGLEVMVQADRSAPIVAVNLTCHVGSKDEPRGRAGLAHLVEHLAFAPSRRVPEGVQSALADVGAREFNARTSRDRTWFFESVPSDRLELAVWIEGNRLAAGLDDIGQGDLDGERKIVESEEHERLEQEPYGLVSSYEWAELFPEPHPYHHPPIGDAAQLGAVTLDEARGFFRTWYTPGNCTLALVGDFDPARATEIVARVLRPVGPGLKVPERPDVMPSTLQGEKRLTVEANVPSPRVVVAWPIVPRFAPGNTELEVGAPALAGYLSGELVEREKFASRVSATVLQGHLASVFEVLLDPLPNVAPEAMLAAFDQRLDHMRALHARYDRVRFAIGRAQLLTTRLYSAERFATRADLLQGYNDDAGTPDYANREFAARSAVIVEDVRKAYFDLLPFDRRVVVFVLPRADAPRAGRVVGPR
ncbi:MAG: M16 family metallopeptidase [Polyangiaceae bacterium]